MVPKTSAAALQGVSSTDFELCLKISGKIDRPREQYNLVFLKNIHCVYTVESETQERQETVLRVQRHTWRGWVLGNRCQGKNREKKQRAMCRGTVGRRH